MKNVVQVVEVEPTPQGQWVTFWHMGEKVRLSGEFHTSGYATAFDRGDIFVCLSFSDEAMSIVGPHPADLLKSSEFSSLPIVADQNLYPRHDRYKRFDLDRTSAVLSCDLRNTIEGPNFENKTPSQILESLAKLH